MILICLAINPVGDCSEMTILGFRSSLLVIIIEEEYGELEVYGCQTIELSLTNHSII